jgi:hypothetical protein
MVLLSLTSLVLVSLNVALDAGCHKGTTAWDRLSPIHCLYDTVHALVGIVSPNEHTDDRPVDASHPRSQPFLRLLNVLAVLAFCASLFQHGRAWHKLLLANAMLCWLLRKTTKRPAAPSMSSNLILTLLEHSIVFAMTDYFEPNDPQCWKWLARTSVPVALLSCLISRPTPEGGQQEPDFEILASLFHGFGLLGLWLFGFSPVAKLMFALHDPQTTFHGLDDRQIMVGFFNTIALQCCLLQHKHRPAGRTWPSVMSALVYVVMVGLFYRDLYSAYDYDWTGLYLGNLTTR